MPFSFLSCWFCRVFWGSGSHICWRLGWIPLHLKMPLDQQTIQLTSSACITKSFVGGYSWPFKEFRFQMYFRFQKYLSRKISINYYQSDFDEVWFWLKLQDFSKVFWTPLDGRLKLFFEKHRFLDIRTTFRQLPEDGKVSLQKLSTEIHWKWKPPALF